MYLPSMPPETERKYKMKGLTLVGLLICLLASALVGCGEHTESPVNPPTAVSERETVTIFDEEGRHVEVPYQPERIACLVPSVAEVICALGDGHRIVARSYECSFPPLLEDRTNVGAATKPNIELLLQEEPRVVIARTGTLFKQELRDKLEAAGVPVIQFRSLELDTVLPMIDQMELMLGKKDKAEELARFIENYASLIEGRIAELEPEEKPLVLFQSMGHMYWSNNAETAGHRRIVFAGGTNIAAEEPVKVPHLSAEWVLEKNPDITVYSYLKASDLGKIPCLEELKATCDTMLGQPGFKEIKAAMDGKVYIIDSRLITGPRSIIGLLYYAKWFHPDLFQDVDPEAVHREMLQRFLGLEFEGTWVYPYS